MVRVKHRLKMVSFHSLLGLRTGLSEIRWVLVGSIPVTPKQPPSLVAFEGRHEKGKGLGRGSQDVLS